MTFNDTFSLAFRNLRQAKLRTTLTTLGVSIGIASLAGMVSLGVGLEEQTIGRFTQAGVFDAITVLPQSAGGFGFGRGGAGRGRLGGRGGRAGDTSARPSTPSPPLDDAAIASLAALENVREVYPNIRVPLLVGFDQYHEMAIAVGIPSSLRQQSAFQSFTAGEFLPDGAGDACMLSLDFVKRLTERDPTTLVGQVLTLSDPSANDMPGFAAAAMGAVPQDAPPPPAAPLDTCRVSGIVERDAGAAFGGGAGVSGLMVPIARAKALEASILRGPRATLRNVTGGSGGYSSLTVRVAGAEHTQDVEDKIKGMNFTAISIADALQGAKRAFMLLDILLSLIGSIALAVSSLGIVNTMVMSILERTREIGIMKAIGGSDGDIRRIFLVEASVIGLLGGATGIVLGWTVGRIINFGANVYIRSQGGTAGNLFSLPWWLIAGAILFAWLVSLIAGSYPARRAARLDPIQALRHD